MAGGPAGFVVEEGSVEKDHGSVVKHAGFVRRAVSVVGDLLLGYHVCWWTWQLFIIDVQDRREIRAPCL